MIAVKKRDARTGISEAKSKKNRAFNAQAFLESSGVARAVMEYRRSQTILLARRHRFQRHVHSKRRRKAVAGE